jgi:hypothetical protein
MGLFDFLTSTRRPPAGTPVLPAVEVRKHLLSVDRPTAPYRLIDGASEGVDVIAEWKIVDASWYEIFAKAGLSKRFSIFMKLHPEIHEVCPPLSWLSRRSPDWRRECQANPTLHRACTRFVTATLKRRWGGPTECLYLGSCRETLSPSTREFVGAVENNY